MKTKVFKVCGLATVALLAVVGIYGAWKPVEDEAYAAAQTYPTARKLFATSNTTTNSNTTTTTDFPNRVGPDGEQCTTDSLLLNQAPTPPMENGIPTYSVYIENVCIMAPKCTITNIHLTCGWFSSAVLINPTLFRRLGYNDCLLNDGQPILPGESLSFTYADTFAYPLSISSVTCI